MRTWARPAGLCAVLAVLAAAFAPGCLSRADAPFTRLSERDPDAAGGWLSIGTEDAGTFDASDELPPTAPHAVLGVNPPRGSFAGGNLALITGNGFGGNVRVWFGDVELERAAIVPIDPQRIQVSVPPGHTGAVDVRVQDGIDESTSAVLVGGYSYDQFFAEPDNGPTSGGTQITLYGDGTRWNGATEVKIDQKPCVVNEVISRTKLRCTTPPGTPGSKAIRVSTSVDSDVLDAFLYSNSDNGYKGGLSGDKLSGELRVLVLNDITGDTVSGATVIVGDDLESADRLKTDDSGVAVSTADLGPKRTVTVARKCFQPQTFVHVDVDRVTVFLDPILSPDCGPPSGDLPASGGSGVIGAGVEGQIVWPAVGEFKRDGWLRVPPPKSDDERLVAYVLRLSGNASDRFKLPAASEAITPSSGGNRGYYFNTYGLPGNFTLFALAGIENRTLDPPTFTAYQMGMARGVVAKAGETKSDVFIPIDVDLDRTLTLDLVPPDSTPRGPDRVLASASIRVGSEGFAPLPNGYISRDLPLTGSFSFVGVPTLSSSLLGTSYVVTARAVTGNAGSNPRSVVGLVSGIDTSESFAVDKFVQVPQLQTPAPNSAWSGTALSSKQARDGAKVDLFVYEIASAGGLIVWKVVAPGSADSFSLPDLKAAGPDLGLSSGPLTITVSAARIDKFVYGALRYRDLEPRGWTAYASDVFFANY